MAFNVITEDVLIKLIKKGIRIFQHIENPSEKVQLAANQYMK